MRASDGALLIVALALCWSLYRAHRADTSFNLLDLIMLDGRVSRIAFVFLGSFVVTSWIMVRITQDGKMTDLLFAAYGAMWVAPVVTRLLAHPPSVKPEVKKKEKA